MDVLFGLTNIPSAIWINEAGVIVRPPEFCSPPPVVGAEAERARQAGGPEAEAGVPDWVVEGIRVRAEDP